MPTTSIDNSVLYNSPQVLIYRLDSIDKTLAGNSATIGVTGTDVNGNLTDGIKNITPQLSLRLDTTATTRLLNLSVAGGTSTDPTTCSISFILGVDILSGPGAEYLMDFFVMDTKAPPISSLANIQYKIMDHIEIYYSGGNYGPAMNDVNLPAYYQRGDDDIEFSRLFQGLVTNATYDWVPGQGVKVSLTCSGLFYWLDLIKVQPKTSFFEWMLRNQENDTASKESAKLLAFQTQYDGLSLKSLIEKILLDSSETNYIFLPEYNIQTVFQVISKAFDAGKDKKIAMTSAVTGDWSGFGGGSAATTPIPTSGPSPTQAVVSPVSTLTPVSRDLPATVITPVVAPGPAEVTAPGSTPAVDEIKSKLEPKLSDIKDSIKRGRTEEFSRTISNEQLGKLINTNRLNRRVMGGYWDTQSLDLIKNNCISFLRDQDAKICAFPVQLQISFYLNGTYTSRLEFLRNITAMSFYEIYQAPQGTTFVKPPIYNSPPSRTISPIEIQSVSRSISRDSILTSVTTQGLMTAGCSKQQRELDKASAGTVDKNGVYTPDAGGNVPEVALPTDFPYIQGTYTCLYPKNFKQTNPSGTIFDVFIPVVSSSISELIDKLTHILQSSWGNSSDSTPNLNIGVMIGKKLIPMQFGDNSIGIDSMGSFTFIDQNINGIATNGTAYLQASACYKALINYGLSSVSTTSSANNRLSIWSKINNSTFVADLTSVTGCSLSVANLQLKINNINASGGSSAVDQYINGTVGNCLLLDLTGTQLITSRVTDLSTLQSTTSSIKFASIFNVEVSTGKTTSDVSGGEYNLLEHGVKDIVINNPLVRRNDDAVAFSRFYLFKNNASAETTTITLSTIRPDIYPGFTIYNSIDSCVYYVQNVAYNIQVGGSVTTTLTLTARRRPVWITPPPMDLESLSFYNLMYITTKNTDPEGNVTDDVTFNPDVVCPVLYGVVPDSLTKLYKSRDVNDFIHIGYAPPASSIDSDVSGDNGNMIFLGWEYYGGPVVDVNMTSKTATHVGTTDSQVFMPVFGAPTFKD